MVLITEHRLVLWQSKSEFNKSSNLKQMKSFETRKKRLNNNNN